MPDSSLQYLKSIVVVAQRHRGAHQPHLTDATWQELILWASPRGLLGRRDDVRGVGVLWDDPRQFGPHDRRYDVGIPIDQADVESIESPAFVLITAPGRYTCVTHEGAYDRIFETYEAVIDGELRYGDQVLLAQPIIEVYRNSPSEVAEADLRTDIYFPTFKL